MRHCLRDPTFSHFDTIPACDGHTRTHMTTALYWCCMVADSSHLSMLLQNNGLSYQQQSQYRYSSWQALNIHWSRRQKVKVKVRPGVGTAAYVL